MKSNLAYVESYTKDDYKHWEGDWELIYGNPYAMAPSPVYGHQFVSGKIYRQLDEKLDDCKRCEAIFEIDLELSNDTVVKPDTMVICYRPIDFLNKTPEIIFEVVSKSSARRDENIKFDLYEEEGVKYYVLVYPRSKKAKVYKLENYKYRKIGDFSNENYIFETANCKIDFDFDFIWRKN